MADEGHLSFFLEWLDPQSAQPKPYILHYYGDQTLELVERNTRRTFLKRIYIPAVTRKDLFIGASLSIYSRQLTVLEAANEYTRQQLQQQSTQASFVVTPRAYRALGRIVSYIEHTPGLQLLNLLMVQFSSSQLGALKTFFSSPIASLSSELLNDVSVVIEARYSTPNALEEARTQLQQLQVPVLVVEASLLSNRQLFPSPSPTTAVLEHCTLCLFRPRVVREGHVGEILEAILAAGFEISALKLFHFRMDDADEFFRVYKGIYRQYQEVLKYMCSGPCIALEVRGEDVVRQFRELCGPHDFALAKTLRPASLRARFGKTTLQNAVHCTDCPEDGVLETQFVFTSLTS
ncbi:hypothetical protein Poli38472_006236 [Pythium oligandrum]|uniref:DM10 domain-containing protein n=1 Tax=Pythium oligandrum TaxID=41045 RepID=A0A8K1CV10_PYTOL|nr:hypothetical protein Poli38472_006236 [Pythium oligandrum]|eukprot:TMW68768.1 hypothetical protein Poli38472_006236 [Pythium oligandrum]